MTTAEEEYFPCWVPVEDRPVLVVDDDDTSATGDGASGLGASSLQQVRKRADVPKKIKEKMFFFMIYQI